MAATNHYFKDVKDEKTDQLRRERAAKDMSKQLEALTQSSPYVDLVEGRGWAA